MKRKKWIVVSITLGLFSVLSSKASATLIVSGFTNDYFVENQLSEEILPEGILSDKVFETLFYAPKDFKFIMKGSSISIPMCFEYQDTGGDLFVSENFIVLDFESVVKSDFQSGFTSDSIFSQSSLGERIELRFPANSFYERGGGIAYSGGSTSLAGIPGSTTLATLGMGMVFVFFSTLGGAEIVDFLRKR